MNSKDKAKKLVNKFMPHIASADRYNLTLGLYNKSIAKKCAIIAIDELIKQNGELYISNLGDKTIEYYIAKNAYLFEVKQEIKKL